MSAIETLGQMNKEIRLNRRDDGSWYCSVDGLCWVRGSFEMGHPTSGATPEQAAQDLLRKIRRPPEGAPHLRERLSTGEVKYTPILLIKDEP